MEMEFGLFGGGEDAVLIGVGLGQKLEISWTLDELFDMTAPID